MPPPPVAIITAASKGMGAACARLLAQRGYRLALFARGSELGNLATDLDALAVTGDLADSAAIEQLVHQTQQRYGRVDAVVNNTGHAAKGELLTLTDEDWHRGLDLLLLNVIRLVTPIMLAQERSGAFVNISSFAAVEPDLHFPVSAIIRAGLRRSQSSTSSSTGPAGCG
jgi:NADP-dependent 3-hydroxy acid dehydrogenase YdfG